MRGLTIVFTGELSTTRLAAEAAATARGATVARRVDRSTGLLVAGAPFCPGHTGSRMLVARALGVRVIDESTLWGMGAALDS